jgi:hypothetical protein
MPLCPGLHVSLGSCLFLALCQGSRLMSRRIARQDVALLPVLIAENALVLSVKM